MKGIHNFFAKLFFVILIAVIISCSLITGVSVYRYINNIKKVTELSLTTNADQKATIYEVNIGNLHNLSASIGNGIEIRDYFKDLKDGKNNEEFYQTLKRDLENDMEAYAGLLENAFFVYNNTIYIDSVEGASEGYNLVSNASEWYIKIFNQKKHMLGGLKKSPVTDLPVMISAYPVLDEKDRLLAVFGLAINLNGFSHLIITNSNNSKENTIIIDDYGRVVAASDTGLIYNYDISKAIPELFQYIEKNDKGITFYNKDGIRYLAAIQKTELGATIIQSIPVSAYRDPVIISVIISIIILIVLIALMAIATFFVARNVTKPIHILVDEFNEMSSGNYDKEIPDYLKQRKDEFSILGNALAEMKRQTSQLILQLNLANEETEASLEEIMATEEEVRKQNQLLMSSESQLKISNEYNKAILSVLPDVIYIINREGVITDCHESMGMLPYLSKEPFLNKNIKDVVNNEISEIVYEKIHNALDTGVLQCFEYEFVKSTNTEIFEFRIIRCFEDAVIAIARNVTDQRMHRFL
jgi:HAMP domain-containing protein